MVDLANRMFKKADRDRNGKVTAEEAAKRGGGGKGKDRRSEDRRDGAAKVAPPPSASSRLLPVKPTKPATSANSSPAVRRRPNFVFILIDDMGWRDMGFAGNTMIDTPHTDKLAQQGVIFTQSYASAPNCAPTRACLLSGLHGVSRS